MMEVDWESCCPADVAAGSFGLPLPLPEQLPQLRSRSFALPGSDAGPSSAIGLHRSASLQGLVHGSGVGPPSHGSGALPADVIFRTVSATEPGNVPEARRPRPMLPRYGSSTLEHVRGSFADVGAGGLSVGLARCNAGARGAVVLPPPPPLPQHSLARQATGTVATAEAAGRNSARARVPPADPWAWRSGLRHAAGRCPPGSELRTTAQELEAELTTGLGRRLRAAARHLDLDLVAALVLAGADVASADFDGRTALHEVAAAAHDQAKAEKAAPILRILLNRGAQVPACDNLGLTPVHLAAGSHIARMLLAATEGDAEALAAYDAAAPSAAAAHSCSSGSSSSSSTSTEAVSQHSGQRLLQCPPLGSAIETQRSLLLQPARAVPPPAWTPVAAGWR